LVSNDCLKIQALKYFVGFKKINNTTITIAELLAHVCLGCGRSWVQIPGRLNLTQACKRFAIASTSTKVAVLPCRRNWTPLTRYTLRRK